MNTAGRGTHRVLASPARAGTARRAGIGGLAGLVALGALPLVATPAVASLAGVGPVSEVNGYPTYFEDASGLQLRLCDDPADGCTMAEVPNPDVPVSFPGNYPGESFYFAAETSTATGAFYEAALEAAFTGEDAAAGENILFARIRIRIDGLVGNATYRITHPYGVLDLRADAEGIINYTDDQGCMAPPCGDFGAAVSGFVGDSSGTSMNFLTSPTFDRATAVAGTPIGSPTTAGPVVGSPFETNFFRVEGPDAGGDGVDVTQTSSFTLEGQVAGAPSADRPSTPDLAPASDSGRASTDNITNVTTPTFTGTATTGPVELLDGATVVGTAQVVDGTYTVTPTTALAGGAHRISVRTPDPSSDPLAPTTLTSGNLTIQVDTAAPAASIGTPRPTNGTLDATPTFSFSAEAGATFECSLTPATESVERTPEACVSPLTYDDQANGTYTFRVRATDAAGNVGAPASHTWTIGALDTTAPTLTGRSPAVNATNVAVGANVTATFSEAVQGVNDTTVTLRSAAGAVAATVRYDAATRVATLDPTADLAFSTTYTATVTGGTNAVRDAANNPLTTTTWSFTTTPASTTPTDPANPAPTVSPLAPTDGATDASQTNNITMRFSEAVQGVTGSTVVLTNAATGATIPSVVSYNTSTLGTVLNPNSTLAAGTRYTVTVTGGPTAIRDTAGAPLVTRSWSFTTAGTATSNTAPTVTTRSPASGATGVARSTNVTATFNEAVQGVSGTTFTLRSASGAAVAATVSYSTTTRVATLNPSSDLAAGTSYTATLVGGSTAIRDTANLGLTTTSWTFTTASTTTSPSPSNPAPTVTPLAPASGATGASRINNITMRFSEAVQGVSGSTVVLRNASTGATISSVVSYNSSTLGTVLNPSSTLAANTRYTVTVTGGSTAIRDLAGAPLVTTSWSFTTGS